jgi:hypothetical protein
MNTKIFGFQDDSEDDEDADDAEGDGEDFAMCAPCADYEAACDEEC